MRTHLFSKISNVAEEEALKWFDEAIVFVRAGSGGAGATAFKFGKGRQHSIPNGGSGGNGGNVIFVVDNSLNTLLGFRAKNSFRAGNGDSGGLEFATGSKGTDIFVPVPKGTKVIDNTTSILIGELVHDHDKLIVAYGGVGGRGNGATKRAAGERAKGSPAEGGERRWLRLELTLVADIGLIGVPNAGKSTLLNRITNARPKIADYPFTTIVPNLGVCELPGKSSNVGGRAMVIADIPGLIEGAHMGVGLGRKFLRHVEKCKIIIHVVSGASDDPIADYNVVNNELLLYSPILASKPQVVVINKIDLLDVNMKLDKILSCIQSQTSHSRILPVSGESGEGLAVMLDKCYAFLQKLSNDERKDNIILPEVEGVDDNFDVITGSLEMSGLISDNVT